MRTQNGSHYFRFEPKTVRIESINGKIVITDRSKIVIEPKKRIKLCVYIYNMKVITFLGVFFINGTVIAIYYCRKNTFSRKIY